MANMFAKLISTRLNAVNVWLSTASEEFHDAGTREWAIEVASEEMAKVTDDLAVLKNATNFEIADMLGVKVATEYHKTKDRLNDYLNK